jgi:hypothetical protein
MADHYGSQLVEIVKFRERQIKKGGLGFDLPASLLGRRGLQILEGKSAAESVLR